MSEVTQETEIKEEVFETREVIEQLCGVQPLGSPAEEPSEVVKMKKSRAKAKPKAAPVTITKKILWRL
eukprot:15204908-Heterocapsa_arctica.AAC.1